MKLLVLNNLLMFFLLLLLKLKNYLLHSYLSVLTKYTDTLYLAA